jgi:hypothetical protein
MKINKNKKMQKKNQQQCKMNKGQKEDANRLNSVELKGAYMQL